MAKVIKVNGNLFKGSITTDLYQITWDYEELQDCCESAEVDSSFGDLSQLIERSISSKIDLIEVETNNGQYDEGGAWKLILGEGEYIEFSNCHNGYYSHNLDVKIEFVDESHEPIKWNTSI